MRTLRAAFPRRPIVASALLIAAASLSLHAVLTLGALLEWRAFDARIAALGRMTAGPDSTRSWSFDFAETTVTVDVPVDRTALSAARELRTRRIFRSSGWLRTRYITTLVARGGSDALIVALAEELDREADALGLSGPDERLEFYVAAVQAIPYGTVDPEIRLPIEVVADGTGVCTEKSLLLAQLLAYEDYATVLWVLPTQKHVALGVATSGEGYHDSGFAFVETTRPAWIGECDQAYLAAGPIARRPVRIDLGGTRRYEAGMQVEYILRVLADARRDAKQYGPYGIYDESVVDEHAGEYADLATRSQYAYRIARWIEANPHSRAEVYSRLTERDNGR